MKPAQVERLTRLEDDEWDTSVSSSGRPFRFSHRAAAGRAFEAGYPSYRFEPCRADFADGTSALFPLVRSPRRLPSLTLAAGMPLGLEGTPILLEGRLGAEHLHGIFQALGAGGRLDVHGGAGGSPPSTGEVTSSVTHTLDLRVGFEALWNSIFSSTNRNRCRKAERAGVEVRRDCEPGAADRYYELYAVATRAWGYTKPPYPRALVRSLLDSGAAELWLAHHDGSLISGAVMFLGSEDVFYWSGALNREFQSLAPSNAVMRAAIESACERGFAYFDFGASGPLAGVEKFKESFGAEPREYRSIRLSTRRYRVLEGWRARLSRTRSGS
jgi:hypothetical protein